MTALATVVVVLLILNSLEVLNDFEDFLSCSFCPLYNLEGSLWKHGVLKTSPVQSII